MSMPTRPVLRYHGGKWRLAPWILQHFPEHRIYTEVFGGAASVLLRKPRSYAEIYNDLDGDLVNLFRVLRDPAQARELERLLRLTPYARAEFDQSYIIASDPIETARKLIVRSLMGFGSSACNPTWKTGFRDDSQRSGTTPAHDWRNYPDKLAAIVERLQGVVVENRPAIDVLQKHDSPQTLHYVDPPYLHDTRSQKWLRCAYRHELTDGEHFELARALRSLKGMVVLSGYPSPLYNELYKEWQRVEIAARADGARLRKEVLWLSPSVTRALQPAAEQLQGVMEFAS